MTVTTIMTTGTQTFQVNLPIVRVPTAQRITVMEILKIAPICVTTDLGTFAAKLYMFAALGTSDPDVTSMKTVIADPNCLWANYWNTEMLTTGAVTLNFGEFDLTDGDGHGKLVVTDSIFLSLGNSFPNAPTFVWKITYRFVTINIIEYIGIVQSQQSQS